MNEFATPGGRSGADGTDGFTPGLLIQSREDGLSIDQIVLRAEKYCTTRSEAAKNDTTMVAAPFQQTDESAVVQLGASTRTGATGRFLLAFAP